MDNIGAISYAVGAGVFLGLSLLLMTGQHDRWRALGVQRDGDVAMHVGQAKVATSVAVSQSLVIET